MSARDGGGPAFPWESSMELHSGMSLRDYFAAKAMAAFQSDPNESRPFKKVAEIAYQQADAMLEARK